MQKSIKSAQKPKRIGNAHAFTSKVERNEAIEKVSQKGWVEWGEDNIYPQHQNSWAYDNAVHGGIINQKVRFITAGGLSFSGDPKVLQNFSAPYTMQEVLETACMDLETNEQFYIHYKKNLDGFWEAHNIEACLIRVDESGEFFHYSEDWSQSNQSPEKTNYRTIKSIHEVQLEDHGLINADRECLMQVQTRPRQRVVKEKNGKVKLTSSYYPIPNYSGALTSIKAGIKMTFFVYSEVSNGYKGGTWINLANGVPATIEEENRIIKKVKAEASDEDLWGGLVVTFSEGKEREPRISQINGNDLDKRYSSSKKDVVREIMIAHGVISSALFGVMSETMFGSREEMEIAYVLFRNNYVKQRQRTMIDPINWANRKLNKVQEAIEMNSYDLELSQTTETTDTSTDEELKRQEFATENQILSLFEAKGIDKKGVKIKHSESKSNVSERNFKRQYIKSLFQEDLTKDQGRILSMIKKGESYQSINKAIGKGANYLSNQLRVLGDLQLIDGWELTADGEDASLTVDDVQVMYSYQLRPDAPALVEGGKSRPFCERLISLNRLYTLDEIMMISATVGRDVFLYRGGWYHNPQTNKNTPSCRHEWRQIIV